MSTLSLDLRGVEASHALPQEAPVKSASMSLLLHGTAISAGLLVSLLQTTTLPEVTKSMAPPMVRPFMVILPAAAARPARSSRASNAGPSQSQAATPSLRMDTPTSLPMTSAFSPDPSSVSDLLGAGDDTGVPQGLCPPGSVCGTSGVLADPPSAPLLHVGGLIREPRLMESRPPVYPPVAQTAGVSGTVVLEAHVGQDGRVKEVRIVESSTLFDEAALASVRSRRYEALLLNGIPTEFLVTITVKFNARR